MARLRQTSFLENPATSCRTQIHTPAPHFGTLFGTTPPDTVMLWGRSYFFTLETRCGPATNPSQSR